MKSRVPRMVLPIVGFLVAFLLPFHLNIVISVGYLCTSLGIWQYHQSPIFLSYFKAQWRSLEEIEPMPFPEIQAQEFSKELFWEITDNLRFPVVIRGAIANSTAVNDWSKEFFLERYADTQVLVKEMNTESTFRIVRTSMANYWNAFEHGGNVSIVASSSLFARHPELERQVSAPFELDIVDKGGNGIFVNQLFVTPGGRTFHHSEFGGNVFRQISGRKQWTIVAPAGTKYMCPYFIPGSALVKPCVQDFEPELREAWFSRLPRMQTILEPGDMLYNPPWAWHDVQSMSDDTRQASVAGRIRNLQTSFGNAPLRSFGVLFDNLYSRIAGTHTDYPTTDFATGVENVVVDSYTRKCVKEGNTNCFQLSNSD